MPFPARSNTGSSSVRIEERFAAIQSRRSIPSGGGSGLEGRSPVYCTTRRSDSMASGARSTVGWLGVAGAGDVAGDPLGDDPVDDHAGIRSSSAECLDGAGGDHGSVRGRVERCAERVLEAAEADVATGFTDDQLARGGVDPAAVAQRHHPVESRARDLAQRRSDRAQRAQTVGARLERVDRRLHPAWVGGFDAQHLEPAVARPSLGRLGVEPGAVEPGAFAAPGPPLLARVRSRGRRRRPRPPSCRRRRPQSTARGGGGRAWRSPTHRSGR